jgi:pilus assembly protein Flp/PilA
MKNQLIQTLRRSRRGQTLVEYGLILLLVAIVVFGVLRLLGDQIQGVFTTITDNIQEVQQEVQEEVQE